MTSIEDNIGIRLPGRAAEVVRKLEKTWDDCLRGKQPDHEIAIYVACPFGTYRVLTLFSQSGDLLLMNIQTKEGHPDILYCPVEQAAFLIQHYIPSVEKPRVIVGFGSALDNLKK